MVSLWLPGLFSDLANADESSLPPPPILLDSRLPFQDIGWEHLATQGLLFRFAPRDRVLAQWLWPYLIADRKAVTEALRMFPSEPLEVLLAPTLVDFSGLVPNIIPEQTLGVYLLGRGIIVLRAPRTDMTGNWDPRGVLKHELVHAVIDMSVRQSVPLWLHEGMAILLSGEMGYLDEARLNWIAVRGNLIPLDVLFDRFPQAHGTRQLAYAQAASFVRFLLRQGGMGDLRRLLDTLAQGLTLRGALAVTYGEGLETLEQTWQEELTSRFSWVTALTSTTVLGAVSIPLVLAGWVRRRLQRKRKFNEWRQEERIRLGLPPDGNLPTGNSKTIAAPFPPNPTTGPPPSPVPSGDDTNARGPSRQGPNGRDPYNPDPKDD